jgi:hypothetical protein
MKSALKYIIPSLLVFLYITASIGIGVHKCDTDGTSTVVLLLKDASSEDIHQNNHYHSKLCDEPSTSSSEHHDHNCCHTELHQLEMGYDLAHSVLISQVEASNLLADFVPCLNFSDNKGRDFSSDFFYGGPPISLQKKSHSYFAQWRL